MSFLTIHDETVDKNTPLSALFWMEATKDSTLLEGWHFEHETEGDPSKFERIGFEKFVKDEMNCAPHLSQTTCPSASQGPETWPIVHAGC